MYPRQNNWSRILEQEAIKKQLEKLRTDKEKENQMIQQKYEQDMKVMREEMENKFQQILAKIDVACRPSFDVGLKIPPMIVPLTLPILDIILFLRQKFKSKKIPTMTTNNIGNGISIEILMLMPKEIPIQTS